MFSRWEHESEWIVCHLIFWNNRQVVKMVKHLSSGEESSGPKYLWKTVFWLDPIRLNIRRLHTNIWIFMTQITTMVWSLTKSQTSWNPKSSEPQEASLQSKLVEVMEFQLSYFKSWKMMLWKCCAQYASKFGKSAVATGLEKVSFHSNPKERQCQRMLKLHNCTHLTR